ncbi:helix-turn-helix domain-containing protein [Curtobacterium sp. MCBD17_003]|uniref:helix-turn-helix domain-containing protein n=1 Tax=Curtobacterium sp. MCBD17_003 TaxID=2175667 RepID=UPI0021AC5ADA|nr:helix-turn-helix domain-containing protein [Curtobacterium sp. MCBD17_003]WIE56255.1 helix-turn-helix domain-containing protein [Curtobacterium sp. MCBD17_003]
MQDSARRLYEQQDMTVAQIGDVLGVSRTTVYRALRRESEPVAGRRGKTSMGCGYREVVVRFDDARRYFVGRGHRPRSGAVAPIGIRVADSRY